MHEHIIQPLVQQFQKNSWTRKNLIKELFQNTELQELYPNEIRRATIVGHITNQVLARIGDIDMCKILAIGDIAYFDELDTEWKAIVACSLSGTDVTKLQGYDLS